MLNLNLNFELEFEFGLVLFSFSSASASRETLLKKDGRTIWSLSSFRYPAGAAGHTVKPHKK